MNTRSEPYSVLEVAFLKRSLKSLHERIAVRAYSKAEQRGFAPGHALDDWLAAEEEILAEKAVVHLQSEE